MKIQAQSSIWRRGLRVLGKMAFDFSENNGRPQMESNGEHWLLRQLVAAHAASAKPGPFVVCDAGANAGGYTQAVMEEARRAGCPVEVHAFEPAPCNVEKLRAKFANDERVRIIGAALAEQDGDAMLFGGHTGSSQASLVRRHGCSAAENEAERVAVLRLEDYVATHDLARIDLLKLDIEGAELAALRGLGGCLRPDVVDVIQFEYGGTTLDAGATLRDLYGLLTSRGYVLAKLFPHALERRDYADWMEHYAYANYVALAPRWAASR